MINLVFTLVSAILGVAMFGAILLADGTAEAKATVVDRTAAGGGSGAGVTAKPPGLTTDIVQFAQASNRNTGDDGSASKPRPTTDKERRTQIAQTVRYMQMAAQTSHGGPSHAQINGGVQLSSRAALSMPTGVNGYMRSSINRVT